MFSPQSKRRISMSYRIEKKMSVTSFQLSKLIIFLENEGMKKLFPKRTIKSVYFDNNSFESFYQSEEGVLPRKKIRVRHYPDNPNSDLSLEIKISSMEGRFKQTKKISQSKFDLYKKFGILDNLYGLVMPVSIVEYSREYYSFDGFRITIDQNILYTKFGNKSNFYDPMNVIELKGSYNSPPDIFQKIIKSKQKRFSKYSNSIIFS